MNRTLGAFAIALTVSGVNLATVQSAGLMNQKYPNVIDVRVHARSDNRFDFDATISSPYDTQKPAFVNDFEIPECINLVCNRVVFC